MLGVVEQEPRRLAPSAMSSGSLSRCSLPPTLHPGSGGSLVPLPVGQATAEPLGLPPPPPVGKPRSPHARAQGAGD